MLPGNLTDSENSLLSTPSWVEARTNIDSHTVEVAGLRTHYLVAGTGAPLLLVHGDGDSAAVWRPALETLASTYRVYALDLPGFGASEPPEDYTPAAYARFLDAFLDRVGVERAAVVGSSFGGLIALHLAFASPDRVTALVLVSSAGLGQLINLGWPSPVLPGYGESLIAWNKTPWGAAQRAWKRAVLLLVRSYRAPRDWLLEQYQSAQRPGVLDSALAVTRTQADLFGQREVVLDRLAQVRVPTLVAWGALDPVLPSVQAWAAVERLAQGSLVVFPDCGHLPYLEQPQRFAAAVDQFLTTHGAYAHATYQRNDR